VEKKTHTKEETRSQQQLQAHNQSIKHQVKQAISKPNRAVPLHLQSPNEQTLMPEKKQYFPFQDNNKPARSNPTPSNKPPQHQD